MNSPLPLIVVFHAEEPELLPLAAAALEQEGIQFTVRRTGSGIPVVFGQSAEFEGSAGPADVLVNPADEARARSVLADLAGASDRLDEAAVPIPHTGSHRTVAAPAYRLMNADSGAVVGDVTAEEFEFLGDELEEESDSDRDYYIDAATIDMLADAGADAELIGLLRKALGSRDGVEITWTRL